jgi:polysaccharide biosynthesis transport protein
VLKVDSHSTPTPISVADRPPLVVLPSQEVTAEGVLSIGYYAWLLLRSKWKIILAVSLSTGLAALYSFTARPIYQATVRISIDPRISSVAVGKDADPIGASDVDQIINTEMQIIQSDAVLRPVAQQFKLLANDGGGDPAQDEPAKSASPPAAKPSKVSKPQSIDEATSDAPVSLRNLVVTHPPNSLLIDISYRSRSRRQAALIANAIAQSYINLGLETRARSSMSLSAFMEKQIAELKKNMENSSLALTGYENKLRVINPNEKTSMVAAHILQLESEYTEAQNDRILKETEYRALKPGSVTPLSAAALEVSPQANMLSRQEEQVHAAEEKLAVAKTVYGPNYAEYKRAANDLAEVTRQYQQMRAQIVQRIQVTYQEALHREELLRAALAEAKEESDQLNANSEQYEELKREAEADKNLYEELFRKIKEAGVNAGFQGSSIRITNQARPPLHPIFPQKLLFIGLAFLLSFMGSVAAVVLADMLDTKLRNPEQTRRFTGCDVVGVLPRVRSFPDPRRILALDEPYGSSKQAPKWHGKGLIGQGHFETESFYCESISILLSTVLHNRANVRPRSLLITSPGAGDGKSSCAAYLALAHANLGKRTLLIDGDLRLPFQHRFFNLDNDLGLSAAIKCNLPLDAVFQRVEGPGGSLDVVVSGAATRHTYSQVGRRIAELLQQADKDYDLVIVDAPPMVGLSDPVQIACATDSVLIVGHADRTSRQSIAGVVSTLHRVNANVVGVVLNQARINMSHSVSHYAAYAAHAERVSE